MKFIIDAQLPPALAKLLRDHGHDAAHVEDVDLRHADDSSIWQFALENSMVIVTKDEDFRQRSSQSKVAPVVVWLRVKNVSRKALLHWFEPLLPKIVALVSEGEQLIEVL